MNTQKGIVFEHKSSYSIFLTEDGLFQKGTPISSSVLVGEEVFFRPYKPKVKTISPLKKEWVAPIVAAVAILFMFFSVLLPAQTKVMAYVQIDLNPSIELGIDSDGDVQHFIGLNEDGVNLKREISFWKGKSLQRILATIVDSTEEDHPEGRLEITTIYKENTSHDSLETIITTAVAHSTKSLAAESVQVKQATEEDRLKANEKGVSVGEFKQNIQKEKKKNDSNLKEKQPSQNQDKKQNPTDKKEKNKNQDKKQNPTDKIDKKENNKNQDNKQSKKEEQSQKLKKNDKEKKQLNDKSNGQINKKSNQNKNDTKEAKKSGNKVGAKDKNKQQSKNNNRNNQKIK